MTYSDYSNLSSLKWKTTQIFIIVEEYAHIISILYKNYSIDKITEI